MTPYTPCQNRIIHQLEAEIESIETVKNHASLEHGGDCREVLDLLEKKARYVALLATVEEAFELINNV